MSSKSKSSTLSETSNNKASPATPRVSKLSRGVTKAEPDSPSPLQNSRLSVDRSPRSINSKPTVERRSPKVTTPPEKQQPTRVLKGSELQAQLTALQEDLKKAKEKLVSVEKEKAKAINELKETQKVADEANEKLREAEVAQKRAEENSEVEKFRAVEMEQAGFEAAQKQEEEWQKELESVRSQHALDVAALLSTTQELQRVKQELAMTTDAKNQALSHADDATKIAEIHVEKAELLSSELTRLKGLLESKREIEANENSQMVSGLKSEIDSLKQELEKAKSFEEKLMEREASIDQLKIELEAAKLEESYAKNLVEEWKKRVEELENRLDEASRLEKSASQSLDLVTKKLEEKSGLLKDAEFEIDSLREKMNLLEISVGKQRVYLEESECRLDNAKQEASEMGKMVESLSSELETAKEEKIKAFNSEKLAASSAETLLEEKNNLTSELEKSKEDEEKSKKAMESLASALHEVSLEAREAKERLLSSQAERETFESRMEDLRLVLKETNEKYESTLNEAKQEINALTDAIELSKQELENSRSEWEQKEVNLVKCVKQSEEENSSMAKEMNRLANLLKKAEQEDLASKEERAQLNQSLSEAESEVIYLKEAIGQTKAESMKLKENLMDKENELQSIIHENEELRNREAASIEKAKELSKLLEEALAKKQTEENGELSDSEKDYDMLPKVVEFSEENGNRGDGKPKVELSPSAEKELTNQQQSEEQPCKETPQKIESLQMGSSKFVEDVNGKAKEAEGKEKEDDDSVEVDNKMWESCKIGGEKDLSPQREAEPESFAEELESKAEEPEQSDQPNGLSENGENGANSPTKQQPPKKKKPLLLKFGSLLKKKSTTTSNQK